MSIKMLVGSGGGVLSKTGGCLIAPESPGPEPTELTELCFTANTAGSTVELCAYGSPSIANTAYSRDRINWTTFTPSSTSGTNTITLTNAGDKVYFRNDIIGNFDTSNVMFFIMSGSIAASGNCNSMYSSTGFNELTALTYQLCFADLFNSCSALTSAPSLPATTVSYGAYYEMFTSCTSLTTAPALPATTLDQWCYFCMFGNCQSLTTVPALPATTLASNCYKFMFVTCTSLQVSDTQTSSASHAWRMPTSETFTNTYGQDLMFTGCLGTRSSNSMDGEQGQSYTYYTQNKPV